MQRPELFEQLDAFDPKWAEHYDTTKEAATAAGVRDLYDAYLAQNPQAIGARTTSKDWLAVSRAQVELRRQEIAEANSGGSRGS